MRTRQSGDDVDDVSLQRNRCLFVLERVSDVAYAMYEDPLQSVLERAAASCDRRRTGLVDVRQGWKTCHRWRRRGRKLDDCFGSDA